MRHGAAGLLQRGEGVPPEGVQRPGGEEQTARDLCSAVRAAEGGAAGLLQTGGDLGGGQGLVLGQLRGGAGNGNGVTVSIRNGERGGGLRR